VSKFSGKILSCSLTVFLDIVRLQTNAADMAMITVANTAENIDVGTLQQKWRIKPFTKALAFGRK